ncbi:MAG: hypothetical protein AABM67_21625 [Acidobacteriota bacterium]
MYSLKRCFWIVTLVLCPIAAMAQDGSAVSNLFRRNPGGKAKTVTVDTPSTAIPSPVEVMNGTRVTVTGRKSPVEICVVATKREELKPEPNPLGQFIKILTGIPIPASATFPVVCPDDLKPGPDDSARRINSALDSLKRSSEDSGSKVQDSQKIYKDLGKRVAKFVACQKLDGTDICSNVNTFRTEREELREKVAEVLAEKLPVIDSVELQLVGVKRLLEERLKTPNPSPTQAEIDWLASVNTRLDCLGQHIASLRQTIDSLKASRAELEKFADLIAAHEEMFDDGDPKKAPLTTYKKVLPEDNNAKVSGTVTCTNFFTKQVSVEAIPFTVTYQDLPRASVTIGVLFTTLNKRQIGTQALRTGTAADGTPTFRNTFAETDRSGSQLVPFSFFNVYLSGTRRMNLNLTGGIGINPNNGKNQAEFFAGGALGFKNVYVQIGGHIGRWQELGGGFGFGETVPANFPGVPIERRYTMRLAVGLSYRLPLP